MKRPKFFESLTAALLTVLMIGGSFALAAPPEGKGGGNNKDNGGSEEPVPGGMLYFGEGGVIDGVLADGSAVDPALPFTDPPLPEPSSLVYDGCRLWLRAEETGETYDVVDGTTITNVAQRNLFVYRYAGDYHQFDNVVLEIGPTVDSITPVSPDPRSTAVSSVDLTFNKTIDLSSFTYADLPLTRDGSPVSLDNSVIVSHASETTYTVNGLSPFTGDDGHFVLTVSALNILSPSGFQGMNTATDAWTKAGPVTVPSTTPSLIGGTLAAGLTSLDLNFSNSVLGGGDAVNFELKSALAR